MGYEPKTSDDVVYAIESEGTDTQNAISEMAAGNELGLLQLEETFIRVGIMIADALLRQPTDGIDEFIADRHTVLGKRLIEINEIKCDADETD